MSDNMIINMNSKQTSFVNTCSSLGFLFLLLYFFDIILLGTGVLTDIAYGISGREIFFLLALVFSFPLMLQERKLLCHSKFLWLTAAFLLIVVIGAVRGYLSGNSFAILKGDFLGFSNLLLLPAMLCLLRKGNRISRLMRGILICTIVFSVFSVILSFFALWNEGLRTVLYDFFENNGLVSLTLMGQRGTRVFPINAVRYYFIAFLFATYFYLTAKKGNSLYFISMCLLILALFLSYSRAFYFAALLTVVAITIFVAIRFRQHLKKLLISWALVLVIVAASIGILSAVQQFNMFTAVFTRVDMGIHHNDNNNTDKKSIKDKNKYLNAKAEADSIDERILKIKELSVLIGKSPVIGNGLGAAIDFEDGLVEYFYHDMLAKVGIIGLLAFLLPALYGAVLILRNKGSSDSHLLCVLTFGGLLYFLIISYFNPCLNSTVGLSLYMLVMVVLEKELGKKTAVITKTEDSL